MPTRLKRGRKPSVKGKDLTDTPSDSDQPKIAKRKKVRWQEENTERSTEPSIPPNGINETEEEEIPEKICTAAWCLRGRVGAAYYEPVKRILHVLEDTEESSNFDLITLGKHHSQLSPFPQLISSLVLEHAHSDVVLTSSKSDDQFLDFLRERADESGSFFQIRPHKDFVPSKGRDRLFSLTLLSDLKLELCPESTSKDAYEFMVRRQASGDPAVRKWNASIRLSNFASLEASPLCMSSIGALLDHLVRERALGSLKEGIQELDIHDIEVISLDQVMHINADALFSLQIFENERHGSVHSDRTKEGLSLFGILNNTKTTMGRSLLRTWLLRPSLSLDVINSRHDAVACFSHSENLTVGRAIHMHLRGVGNVPRILGMMQAGKARLSEWHGLVKFTFHAAMIRDTLNELHQASGLSIVNQLISALDITYLREIGGKVNGIIDWEESVEVGRVCVRHHVDNELDNRKYVYHGIDAVLSKVAHQISEQVPCSYATSLNVVYFPQLGFLICLPMLEGWQTEASVPVIEGWSFQFSSNAHVYFKSKEMHDMDTHIGDLHSAIVDRELEIIENLQEEILVYCSQINRACYVCAELDCLLSFAEASQQHDYRRPTMTEDNVIDIHQGRHPLQEMVVDLFVPNDTLMVGNVGGRTPDVIQVNDDQSGNAILVCTGANACGKSVYLKQIALIQYMAQIGCFVPAEAATLGVVDKIFTRISTRESVSKIQSAFMIDLNQVSLALRNCTVRSLILLDEFGKGTLAADGAGILCGVLKHLLDRGPQCPKVLVATHFHDVFREDILSPNALPISFCHMQVLLSTSSQGPVAEPRNASAGDSEASKTPTSILTVRDKITYLYRVAKGLFLDSHAAQCASLFGLPARIVQRAGYVSELLTRHELGHLLDEEMSEKERQDLAAAEAVCRRFLAWDLDATEEPTNVKKKIARCLKRGDLNEP